MGKHTPGPWEIVSGDEWTTDIGTPEGKYEDGRKRHWNVASVNKRRDEWEANRRLIAAAPDLLTAAIEAKASMDRSWETKGADDQWIYDEMGSDLAAGYFSLRAAIAKATGETP